MVKVDVGKLILQILHVIHILESYCPLLHIRIHYWLEICQGSFLNRCFLASSTSWMLHQHFNAMEKARFYI